MIAKSVYDALGAKTYVINNEPNGLNINLNCGSTHIDVLKKYVKDNGLDVAFAFDGDADRCIAVDENGNEVNGDLILYICGKYMKENGRLNGDTIVTTIMSNLGLYKACDKAGLKYEKTAVGDKYVYENMSIFAIVKHLNSLGHKTSHGKPFEKRSIEYILQNPGYAGDIRWNRTINETNEIRDPSEWIIRPGHHPAIIEKELFEKAQERYHSEYKRRNAKPSEISKHWLSGSLNAPSVVVLFPLASCTARLCRIRSIFSAMVILRGSVIMTVT